MRSLFVRCLGRWALEIALEPRDAWVGVFWKREPEYGLDPRDSELHPYWCPLPCVLLHFVRGADFAEFCRLSDRDCTCCRLCGQGPCGCGFTGVCEGSCVCEELASCPGRS